MGQESHWAQHAPGLVITRAQWADLDTIVSIEEDAIAWLRGRGLDPAEPPRPLREIYADRVRRAEVYIGWLDDKPVGMLTLQWADRQMWGDVPDDAVYVHGLMVRRDAAGQQVGGRLLRWAAGMALAAGKTYVRLDCKADNPALRAYYERAGFALHGEVTLRNYTGARYEKRAREDADAPDAV